MKLRYLPFLLLPLSLPAYAFEGQVFSHCEETPEIDIWHFPRKGFNNSANLLRKSTEARRAQGEYLIIKGKVLDRNCVPVQNALVRIWQPDHNGNYEDAYPRDHSFETNIAEGADPYFGYTGTARTDNFGNFAFLTIFPGSTQNYAPHINYVVQHRDFEELTSRLYFAHHPANETDSDFQALTAEQQPLVIANGMPIDPSHKLEGRQYQIVITLDGENTYRRY